jgi:hypothetical protein
MDSWLSQDPPTFFTYYLMAFPLDACLAGLVPERRLEISGELLDATFSHLHCGIQIPMVAGVYGSD